MMNVPHNFTNIAGDIEIVEVNVATQSAFQSYQDIHQRKGVDAK